MSASYTFHPAALASPGDPAALEGADLVRDGFSWAACLTPALWFLRHRHWLPALFAVVVVAGLALGMWAAGARIGTIVAAEILLHLLFGLEGASLRRLDYAWRGRPTSDVVIAPDAITAETKSFARWLAAAPAAPAGVAAAPPARRGAFEPGIGLFPDMEGRP